MALSTIALSILVLVYVSEVHASRLIELRGHVSQVSRISMPRPTLTLSSRPSYASSLARSAATVKPKMEAMPIIKVRTTRRPTLEAGPGPVCDLDYWRGPKKSDFPKGFLFGTATSAYQIEGAWNADGKGESIWDTFSQNPGKVMDGSNGAQADDSYYNIDTDVGLLASMGMNSYRFSIAWSRVLPAGTGAPNEAGIAYYNNLIDALLKAGIQPAVTLYHWDLPEALQEAYGGYLSPKIIDAFANYAWLCFDRFGDRVKTWITYNEPQEVTIEGFGNGGMAPGRCSDRTRCYEGDSATEPYIVAKNLLLSHAKAVRLYREHFQAKQGGRVGITLNAAYLYPFNPESDDDWAAAEYGLQMQFSWFAHPVVYGNYPEAMFKFVGDRLPGFSAGESAFLAGTVDFIGLNFYTAQYAKGGVTGGAPGNYMDGQIGTTAVGMDGNPIGPQSGSPWLYVVPESIQKMLEWVHRMYPDFPIIITENGVSQWGGLTKDEILCDAQRVQYYQDYITYVHKAMKNGVPVQGYYAWSLLDNFEWAAGYTQRFGLHYVDYNDPARTRIPKASAYYWSQFMKN